MFDHLRTHHVRERGQRRGPERGQRGPGGHGRHGFPGASGPFGGLGGFRGFGGRGAMVRRGDVRSAILALLAEEPMHGYQVMQELSERSGGMWRPSAGSIYPTLQQLEDEVLVRSTEQDGRRVFSLTEAGQALAAKDKERGGAPWDIAGVEENIDLRKLALQLIAAALQITQVGSPEAVAKARQLLAETRRGLYRLLADDGASPLDDDTEEPAQP